MITRRTLLLTAAAVVPVSACDALARFAGVAEAAEVSRSFTGPGWYLFGRKAFWATESSSERFPGCIDLAHRPGGDVAATVAPDVFDASATAKHIELPRLWLEDIS